MRASSLAGLTVITWSLACSGTGSQEIPDGPESEVRFCVAIKDAARTYLSAENDLKRSEARNDRGRALRSAVPGGRVHHWSAMVSAMTTTSNGSAVLEMDLPCGHFGIGTWNNEASDVFDHTLIRRDSKSYEILSEMSVGMLVWFNGTLIPDDRDGFKETSVTELGSMTDGFFLLRM